MSKHTVESISKTFDYVFHHPWTTLAPWHLYTKTALGIDERLFDIILCLALSNYHADLIKLANGYEQRKKALGLNNEVAIIQWFTLELYELFEKLSRKNRGLKDLKCNIHRFAVSHQQPRQIVNLAAMTERLRISQGLRSETHDVLKDFLAKKIQQHNGDSQPIDISHQDYVVVKNPLALDAYDFSILFRDEQERQAIRKKKWYIESSVWLIALLVCSGEAVIPAVMLLLAGASFPIFSVALITAFIISIIYFRHSGRVLLREIILDRFFLDYAGKPMSKFKVYLSTVALVAAFFAALAYGCLAVFGFFTLAPYLLLPGIVVGVFTVLAYTGLIYRVGLTLTKSSITNLISDFFKERFIEASLPMKIINGLTILIAAAVIILIAVATFKFFVPLLAGFFAADAVLSLGAASAISYTITVCAMPALAFFSATNILNFGLLLAKKVENACKILQAVVNKGFQTVSKVFSKDPALTRPLLSTKPLYSANDNEKLQALKSLAYAARIKTITTKLILLGIALFNSFSQSVGPATSEPCIDMMTSLGVPDTVAPAILVTTSVADTFTGYLTAIDDTVPQQCIKAANDDDATPHRPENKDNLAHYGFFKPETKKHWDVKQESSLHRTAGRLVVRAT